MRKLVYSTSLSLDGYIDSAAGDPSWVVPDEELHRHFNEVERKIDTLLYPWLRIPNLALAPFVAGLITRQIAVVRAKENLFVEPRVHFWRAFWFTLAFAIIRFAYASHQDT